MPNKNIVSRVLDWLRAGYPDDIPVQDRAAVMAVLRRRLADEQLEDVIRRLMASRAARGEEYVSDQRINEYIRKVVDDVPKPQEIDRVARILGAHGLLISKDHFGPEDGVSESDSMGYVRYEDPSDEELETAQAIAASIGEDSGKNE